MKRRTFLAVLATFAPLLPVGGLAQAPARRPLIGLLAVGSKAAGERYYGRVQEGMREFGYVESRDYAFESRYADGDFARVPLLAEELARLKPDVIIVSNTAAGDQRVNDQDSDCCRSIERPRWLWTGSE